LFVYFKFWNVILKQIFLNEDATAVVKYEPAAQTTKRLFASDNFKTRHDEIFKLIQAGTVVPGSKWMLIDSAESFRKEYDKAVKAKRAYSVIGLITKTDSRDGLPPNAKIFSSNEFLKIISKVDRSLTVRGLCKR